MRFLLAAAAMVMVLASSASSQQGPQNIGPNPNQAFFLSAADVTAHRNKLQNVAYANITLVERVEPTSPSGIAYRMAVDRRRPPQRAAAHATEGEIWAIVDGSGEITTGGRIVETKDGTTVNRRIEGGTVHKVSKGDFLLIPENVPHQVTGVHPGALHGDVRVPPGREGAVAVFLRQPMSEPRRPRRTRFAARCVVTVVSSWFLLILSLGAGGQRRSSRRRTAFSP